MKYVNHRLVKSAIAPGASVKSGTSSTYLSSTTASKRNTIARDFIGAIACIKSGAQGTYTVQLILTSGGVEYQLDEVVLTAGESATWNEMDYGMRLEASDTVKLEFTGANTTSTDRVYFIVKTRDVA
jgi:hypothetical protein